MALLDDKYGRRLDYLRLSVTDRCNFRCKYCMPVDGIEWTPRKELLTYEEIIRFTKLLKKEGLKKIRITGGEPFVRKDIVKLLVALREEVKIDYLHITTNGSLTLPFIPLLKDLQINSVNLSLDTLRKDRFFEITRRDKFMETWGALIKLIEAGIKVNINVVVQKGINDDEIIPFIKLAHLKPITVRFIEAMPFNGLQNNKNEHYLSFNAILKEIIEVFPHTETISDQRSKSSAVYFNVPGYKGNFAIIPAFSRTLCGTCNRLRLTAIGEIKTCLYADSMLNIRDIMRAGVSDKELLSELASAVKQKHSNGFEAEAARNQKVIHESMVSIGG